MATAEEKYRARAAELREQSKLVQDPQVAVLLEEVANCLMGQAITTGSALTILCDGWNFVSAGSSQS
jgi:hypothetical protein